MYIWLLFSIIITTYYMAVSHKDWELPNSWIWLAEIDIDRGLDFPIYTGISTDGLHFAVKKLQTKYKKYWLFSSKY